MEDRSRHLIGLDVFVVRVQGVEVIRDAMLDMWEAELGADFTPKAGVDQKHHDKCQIWEGLALLKGSSESGLCTLSKFRLHARHELAGFLSSTIGVVHLSTSSVSRLSQTRVSDQAADGCWVSLDLRYASRIKIIHRSWREANKSVALPEEEEKAPSRW